MSLNVDRMRRYPQRTELLLDQLEQQRADRAAQAAGFHCAACETQPAFRSLHSGPFAELIEAFRKIKLSP